MSEVVISRDCFVILVTVFGLGMFMQLVNAARNGHTVKAPALVLVASPVFVGVIWTTVQHRQPSNFTLQNISYAAVIGDVLVIPTALCVAAWGWSRVGHELNERWTSWQWSIFSYVVGLLVGIGFHVSGGYADSHSANLKERLHDAALSWAHNIGVFPALFGAMVYLTIPLLTRVGSVPLPLSLIGVCVLIWIGLSFLDSIRAGLPTTSPWHFDPNWLNNDPKWPLRL